MGTAEDLELDDIGLTRHSSGTDSTAPVSSAPTTFSAKWTIAINGIRKPVLSVIQSITHFSAVNPKRTIAATVLFALGIFVVGLFTGFSVDVDEDVLWTPTGSFAINHLDWINDESGFPTLPRDFIMVFHQDGGTDILGQDQTERIFQALDTVRSVPGFESVCSTTSAMDACPISGVTNFWNNSAAIFASSVDSDEDALRAMSAPVYPNDGTPVSDNAIFGNAVRDETTGLLVSAQSYMVVLELPEFDQDGSTDAVEDLENDALDAIQALAEQWEREPGNALRVEVFAQISFSNEFTRAILKDIPLVPIVFVIMGIFTSAFFFKRDKVRSRSLLGFMAVVSVLLSILAGYGLMFVCSVPFTSMTQILPFVFFGVGLDDSFIITGTFFRLDPSKDIVTRVHETIEDIGMSIFLTTLTSSLAFGLGCLSSIPGVFWLCLYAVPTMVLILFFQLTFFVGCLVLDERRVQQGNRDCLRCLSRSEASTSERQAEESAIDRFMGRFAEKLLNPVVKVVVVLAFTAIAAACALSASRLEQSFTFTEVLPGDSYITPFFDAFNGYSVRSSIFPYAYFRDVDQSDVDVQDAMERYVNDIVAIDAVVQQPEFFWLRDFRSFTANTNGLPDDFTAQLDAFLADPVFSELYRNDIVRDASSGAILTSRVGIYFDNVDIEDVTQQIKTLEDQRAVSKAQPINMDSDEFRFFTYDQNYNIWEFYAVSADEIVITAISGVAAVTVITLIWVPHWTAALFVLPLICFLYIDLLGVMQWAGLSINPVSYIGIVMSIGLLIDFILHMLIRYYEAPGNRREKSVDTLKTMGSSILVGGTSTFLGTLPLAFSTSAIFNTVFITFLGLVAIGASHGLILLPVVMSIIGPEDNIKPQTFSKSPGAVAAVQPEVQVSQSDDDEEVTA